MCVRRGDRRTGQQHNAAPIVGNFACAQVEHPDYTRYVARVRPSLATQRDAAPLPSTRAQRICFVAWLATSDDIAA